EPHHQDDGERVLAAGAAPADRLGAGHVGRGRGLPRGRGRGVAPPRGRRRARTRREARRPLRRRARARTAGARVRGVRPLVRRRAVLLALAAGVVTALSVPPFGWWILGPIGLAGLCVLL